MRGTLQYHIPSVLRFKGNLNQAFLQWSLNQIINRHEVLRTVFEEKDGRPFQKILEKDCWNLSYVEKIGSSVESLQDGLITAEINRPFDLANEHPLRARLIKVEEHEYLLVLVVHHIAADGWSLSVLVKEFMELYRSRAENRPVQLPALEIQYADYALWERNYLEGAVLEEKLGYWTKKLQGLVPLEMPTDYPRPLNHSINGASIQFQIDHKLSKRLRELCQDQGVTMFMLLLSIYKILLHRYSGQTDICVGTTVANRPQQEIGGLIGFFVNAFALRSDLNSDPLFLDFLQQVKATTLEAYTNVSVPFSKVVERVEKKRDQSRSPLFQVLFVLNNNPTVPILELDELKVEAEPLEASRAKFDLSLFVNDAPDGISMTLGYCTDLFKPETIEQLKRHFNTLLATVTHSPNRRLSEFSLMNELEEKAVLQLHTKPVLDYHPSENLVSLFRKQAKCTPDLPAIVYGDKVLTYRQLDEESDRLGHYLRQTYSIQPNDLIGLMLTTSEWALISILGVLKSGAGYVPLDIELPKPRKSFIITDTGMKALIVESDSLLDVLDYGLGIFSIDIQLSEIESTFNDQAIEIASDHLAYIIYTSGSTGQPKGVQVTHGNLVDYTIGLKNTLPLERCQNFGLMSTLSADLGNTVLFGALMGGGCLHLFNKNKLMDADYMQQYFSEHQIDCIKIVPSHWKALETSTDLLLPKQLLIFGGERLDVSVVNQIHNMTTDLEIVNHYGPTEGTIGKLLHRINRNVSYNHIPIGQPFSETSVFVVDKHLNLNPIGVPGELLLAGKGIAKGYLNLPDQTAERFVEVTFGKHGKIRCYRTGDRVRMHGDGNIEFLGRIDDQVKIRGYRIELGEIAHALNEIEGISQSCVLVKDRQTAAGMSKYLVGYYVLEDGASLSVEDIDHLLHEVLPDYMVPAAYQAMDSFPLTVNGKLDKRSLPEVNPGAGEASYQAPENELETSLVQIWSDVLGLGFDQISVESDFFKLGGDSILSIQVSNRIRRLGYQCQVRDIFDHRTIKALSIYLLSVEQSIVIESEQGVLTGSFGLYPVQLLVR